MTPNDFELVFPFPFGVLRILNIELDKYKTPELTKTESIISYPQKEAVSNPITNRLIIGESEEVIKTPLAPLVLLSKTETPLSFEESITLIYKDQLDDIEIFFQSSMIYGEDLHGNLGSENHYGLTLPEFLSLYFYTLEWNPPFLNLYSRLNRDLTSSERRLSEPNWRFYLHYFSALRKIPMWQGNHDLQR